MIDLPRPAFPLVVVALVTLGGLFVAVVGAQLALVPLSDFAAAELPEFASLQQPILVASIALGVCIQIALIVTGVLVGLIRAERILDVVALRLVDVLAGSAFLGAALIVVIMTFIPGPPALGLLLLAGALLFVAIALIILVLRSLLRGSILLRTELDEVV